VVCHSTHTRTGPNLPYTPIPDVQAKMESVQLARMWEAEKRRIMDENRELNEDVMRVRHHPCGRESLHT
jgi:hypothetical protein